MPRNHSECHDRRRTRCTINSSSASTLRRGWLSRLRHLAGFCNINVLTLYVRKADELERDQQP
jgi:hypothetical protein